MGRKQLFLIIPEGKIHICWNLVLTIFIFLSSLVFPYRIVSGNDPLDWFYWLITIVFLQILLLSLILLVGKVLSL